MSIFIARPEDYARGIVEDGVAEQVDIESRLRNSSSKSRIKFLVTDVTLYGLAGALYSLIGLISVPILTRNLSMVDYGILEILLSIVGMAVVMGALGQDSAFARFHYDTESKTYRDNIIGLGFAIQSVSSLFVITLLFVIGSQVELLHAYYKDSAVGILALTALVIPATISSSYIRNVLKWTFRRSQYAAVSLLYSILLLVGYGVLVHYMHMGLNGALLSMIVALTVPSIMGLALVKVTSIGSMDFSYIAPMLRYGVPYMLLGLMNQGLRVIDKIAVSFYQGVEAAAVYAVGFKVASILVALDSLFHMSWGPISLAIFKADDASKTYSHALNIVVGVMALSMLVITGFANEIVLLLSSSNFSGASTVAVILSFGLALQSVAGVASIGIDLAKKTRLLVLSWCLGAVIAIGIILTIGPKLGMIGVALGITGGFVIESLARILLGRMAYSIRFDGLYNLIYIPASVLLMYIINEMTPANKLTIAVKLLIIAGFALFWLKKTKAFLN